MKYEYANFSFIANITGQRDDTGRVGWRHFTPHLLRCCHQSLCLSTGDHHIAACEQKSQMIYVVQNVKKNIYIQKYIYIINSFPSVGLGVGLRLFLTEVCFKKN